MADETYQIIVDGTTRKQRLSALQAAVGKYVAKERERLNKELVLLKAALDGRTAGKGIQSIAVDYCSAVARKDLKSFLEK